MASALVQIGWQEILRPRTAQSRLAIVGVLVTATAYFLASLWCHASGPRRPRLGLIGDLMVLCLAAFALAQGHESGILRLGLWIVPPTLLTFASLSAGASFFAQQNADKPQRAADLAKVTSSVALAGVLLTVEFASSLFTSR